jgi:hypothetical protein
MIRQMAAAKSGFLLWGRPGFLDSIRLAIFFPAARWQQVSGVGNLCGNDSLFHCYDPSRATVPLACARGLDCFTVLFVGVHNEAVPFYVVASARLRKEYRIGLRVGVNILHSTFPAKLFL